MQEKRITYNESLDIISQMIQNTRYQASLGSGSPFLIWGYSTIITSVLIATLLLFTEGRNVSWYWLLILIIGGPIQYVKIRKHLLKRPVTFLERTTFTVWLVIGAIAVFFTFFHSYMGIEGPRASFQVLTILSGIGTIITGLLLRFMPCVIGGILGILTMPAYFFFFNSATPSTMMYLFAFVFVVMMIIPGHILNYVTRKGKLLIKGV